MERLSRNGFGLHATMSGVNRSMTRLARTVAAVLCGGLALAACGGEEGPEAASPSPSVTSSPSPSSTVDVPSGVKLTEVGADLSFGDSATVIHEPSKKRGSVLEITVKDAQQGSIKDFSGYVLDDYTRKATPYYVDVTVKNVGDGEVGGVAVPVWGVDGSNTLLPPATFTTPFRRCPSKQLPKKFKPDDEMSTCLVFLAPDKGTLKGVSYRPNQEFDPIVWTGQIATPEPKQKKKGDGGDKGGKKDGKKKRNRG